MPLHKKITAIVVFALCGFLGGFISQAQAMDVTSAGVVTIYSDDIDYVYANTSCHSSFGIVRGIMYSPSTSNGFQWGTSDFTPYCSGNSEYQVNVESLWQGSHTNGDGINYWISMYNPIVGGSIYSQGFSCQIQRNSGVWSVVGTEPLCGSPTPPTTASTTINTIAPSGTIASSSPITITITGTLGTTDLASTTAAGNTIRLLSWVGGVDTSFVSPNQTWTLSTDGSFTKTYQVTTDLPAGNFKIYASITSAGTYDCSAIDSGGVCIPIGGINVATTTYFTLNSSYFEHITGTSTPTNLYTPQPCGISDLSGCFQNALAALFYPKSNPAAAVNAISEEARSKFPFVYVYQLGAIRTSLLTASSTAPTGLTVNLWKLPNTATTTIELISQTKVAAVPFSGTIYTVLTWLIWLLMAEYIYVRVIKMHDTHTPS